MIEGENEPKLVVIQDSEWIQFDSISRTFSGTPLLNHINRIYEISLEISDTKKFIIETFEIEIPNSPPYLNLDYQENIQKQFNREYPVQVVNQPIHFKFKENTFEESDG